MAEDTGQTPLALLKRPKLKNQLLQYLDAFSTLSSSRKYEYMIGDQPIEVKEIGSFLTDFKGMRPGDTKNRWLRYIKALDQTFLDSRRKKRDS